MFGRSVQNYNVAEAPRTKMRVPELFYDMTLDEALGTEIQLIQVRKTLGWIARNRPLILEQLMGGTEPGTRKFAAICLVYEAFERRVKAATEDRNSGLKRKTREGIRRSQHHSKAKPLNRSHPNVLFRGPQAC